MPPELLGACERLIPVADNATPQTVLEAVTTNYRRFAECRIMHDALVEAVK